VANLHDPVEATVVADPSENPMSHTGTPPSAVITNCAVVAADQAVKIACKGLGESALVAFEVVVTVKLQISGTAAREEAEKAEKAKAAEQAPA